MAFKDRGAALSAGSFVGVRLFPVKQEMKLARQVGLNLEIRIQLLL